MTHARTVAATRAVRIRRMVTLLRRWDPPGKAERGEDSCIARYARVEAPTSVINGHAI
jgi:hypothetical protein